MQIFIELQRIDIFKKLDIESHIKLTKLSIEELIKLQKIKPETLQLLLSLPQQQLEECAKYSIETLQNLSILNQEQLRYFIDLKTPEKYMEYITKHNQTYIKSLISIAESCSMNQYNLQNLIDADLSLPQLTKLQELSLENKQKIMNTQLPQIIRIILYLPNDQLTELLKQMNQTTSSNNLKQIIMKEQKNIFGKERIDRLEQYGKKDPSYLFKKLMSYIKIIH